MKKTMYRIEGTSEVEPLTDLPEGFKVTTEEVDVPTVVRVRSVAGGRRLTVERSAPNEVVFEIQCNVANDLRIFVSKESARQVRDGLNAILGDAPEENRKRVLIDGTDDEWFETAPNRFTWAQHFGRANAEQRAADGSTVLVNMTQQQILDEGHGIKEIREAV